MPTCKVHIKLNHKKFLNSYLGTICRYGLFTHNDSNKQFAILLEHKLKNICKVIWVSKYFI